MLDQLEIAARRQDKESLVALLESAGARFRGNACNCPFHDDRSPSAGVYEADDGAWKFKCQAQACGVQGDFWDIAALAEGRKVSDVLPKNRQEAAQDAPGSKQKSKEVFPDLQALKTRLSEAKSVFQYTNPDTLQPELVVFRMENAGKKHFIQASPCPGGWVMSAPKGLLPLYNRARVRKSPEVIVVEGEKCVHALADLGFIATTAPGGAGKASYADWTPLAGKVVYLWPDNDKAGLDHMEGVQAILERLEPRPRLCWIDPQDVGLPEKGDAADFIELAAERGREAQIFEVRSVLNDAKFTGPESSVREWIEKVISGELSEVHWPWPLLTRFGHMLMPATVTAICSAPGATKSLFLLEAAAYWHNCGIPIAIYELEEDRTFHLMRALAQQSGESSLTDMDWMKANPSLTRNAFTKYQDFLSSFGACIWAAPEKDITKPELAAWIEERAKAGVRIIAVDPYTAAAQGDKVWIEDGAFVNAVKRTAKKYGCSIIIVMHPKKGSDTEMAGGSSFGRLFQNVLWMEFFPERQDMSVICSMGIPTPVKANRAVLIEKTRNGKGTKMRIAFDFNGDSLTFTELGIIARKQKKG